MALNYGRNSRHIVFGTTSKGPTGPQGPKGAKGDTGSSGPVGGISSISADLSLADNKIINLGAPSDDTDASTKKYVDSQILTKISHDGSTTMSSDLDMGDNRIVNVEDPVSGSDAATKLYVDQEAAVIKAATDTYTMLEVGKKLSLDGSTKMTGDLDMSLNKIVKLDDPGSDPDAANKRYVDKEVHAGFLSGNKYTALLFSLLLDLAGAKTMTGNLKMGGKKIISLGTPTADTDATTKKYVDDSTRSASILEADGSLDMNLKKIGNLAAPTSDGDATTKKYVDDKSTASVLEADGSLNMKSKKISNLGAPTSVKDATTKEYVDSKVSLGTAGGNARSDTLILSLLDLAGSRSMTGNLDVGGNKIVSLGTPTADTDACTKKYSDDNKGSASILEADGSLDMKGKLIQKLANPGSGPDAANKTYVDNKVNAGYVNGNNYTNGKIGGVLDLGGARSMTGDLNMGSNKILSLGTPTGDADASTKKYVDDTSASAQAAASLSLVAMGVKKVSVDGTSTMSGGLDMGNNGISNLSDPTKDGDAANKKYVDSKSTSAVDTSKFVTIDKSGYKVVYAGGTYKTFSYTTTGYNKPYNGGYGSDLTVTEGNKVRVPVVGEMKSLHIEQDPDSSGVAEIRITTPMPNSYWTAGKTQGIVFAAKHKHPTSQTGSMWIEQASSLITHDTKLLGVIGGYSIYLSRVIYDSSVTPLTVVVSFKYVGVNRMVLDLYPGFVFDGIDRAKYYSSNLSNSLYYPTYPQYDHHKFIDSTVGDVLIAGIQNPDGILTVDKLLITEKNIDTSPSSWFHMETGKSFVTDLPFGEVVRGVNTFTFHRMTLPPAKKITLIIMSVDGNTVLEDSMVFELGAKFYVGGGSSTTGKLTDIRKSDALIRCEGVTHLNKDVVVSLPNLCIGFEMYMRQTNLLGSSELNKKITILVRVFNG